jgi:hypothetical protein
MALPPKTTSATATTPTTITRVGILCRFIATLLVVYWL